MPNTATGELVELMARPLLKALELKDPYTYRHSLRVAYFGLTLGHELGFNRDEMRTLELSALLHDIGKIGIPDTVLQKPERLNEAEFNIMKLHPEKSGELLSSILHCEDIMLAARHHHERYDGRGYPDRLVGEQIPTLARIILIADTFDAMTSTRPYREGLEHEIAFNELREFAGTQFDPALVQSFIRGMQQDELLEENTFYLPILRENIQKKAA